MEGIFVTRKNGICGRTGRKACVKVIHGKNGRLGFKLEGKTGDDIVYECRIVGERGWAGGREGSFIPH